MAVAFLASLNHEILLFAVVGLTIGGLDDLIMDLLFLSRTTWRASTIYVRHPRMTTATMPPSAAPGSIAILIPAWQESAVIGAMLRHTLARWDGSDYRLFVGVYPNDPATIAAVADVAAGEPHIVMAINPRPGPTTKADCLNQAWRAMQAHERAHDVRFKAVVLHDAEDVVHADEIRLFDLLIDRFDMVQLPVLPLPGRGGWLSRAIGNHYGDEFAESHGKMLCVREALGASVPSAGVACAFRRDVLARLAPNPDDGPFDPSSLTEDYEAGLRIRDMGGRTIFVRMRDGAGQLVATKEYFPDTLDAAVKQKARWIIGIALAGWDRMGWRGGPAEWWMRLRDRRSMLAALILFAAYLSVLLWATIAVLGFLFSTPVTPVTPTIAFLLRFNFCLLVWRAFMRFVFVGQAYGWRQGLIAIPRTFIANIIAILAARRAMDLYIRSLLGRPLVWDKTDHHFPTTTDMAS